MTQLKGAVRTLLFLLIAFAIWSQPFIARAEYQIPDWGRNAALIAGGLAAAAGLSQLEDSPILFAALEGGIAFYLVNEQTSKSPQNSSSLYFQWVTPLALTTLALVNLTILREEDTTKGDVFRVNAAGLAAITLWHFWSAQNSKAKDYFFTYSSGSGWRLNRIWRF